MPSSLPPLAYSIKDAMRVSSIGRTRIFALLSEGKLERVKVGSRTLIKADSLHRLLEIGT